VCFRSGILFLRYDHFILNLRIDVYLYSMALVDGASHKTQRRKKRQTDDLHLIDFILEEVLWSFVRI